MPFGMVSGVGRGMGVSDGAEGRDGFGMNLGHPVVTSGDWRPCCVYSCARLFWGGLVLFGDCGAAACVLLRATRLRPTEPAWYGGHVNRL